MSEDIVGLAHGMLDAVKESGCTPTGWWVSPKVAVQIADYFGIDITIPEDLTSLLGLPVEVDPAANGIALLRERPGIRIAHNDPISDTPERILSDLIAELRDQVGWYPPDVFPDFTADDPASQSRTPDRIAGVAMRDAWTRAAQMADRAEARLREVQGE